MLVKLSTGSKKQVRSGFSDIFQVQLKKARLSPNLTCAQPDLSKLEFIWPGLQAISGFRSAQSYVYIIKTQLTLGDCGVLPSDAGRETV